MIKLDKNGQRRGGARPGAGRPRKGPRVVPHVARAEIDPTHPQYVRLYAVPQIGGLRRREVYDAILGALETLQVRSDFRICHYSVQDDHVHLICEASDRAALSSGLRGFTISAARRINRALTQRRGVKRRGQVFGQRYDVTPIETIAGVRQALVYVLNNWRRHGADEPGARLDPYASGPAFGGWREPLEERDVARDAPAPVVSRPETWLLSEGWKRAEPTPSMYEVPGRS